MHDVRHRAGIQRAQFGVACDLYVLQKFPNLRVPKPLRLKLFLGHFAIDQSYRRNVGQTVIGCLARLGFPFLRLTADNIHRRIVTLNHHRAHRCQVANFVSQRQRSFNRALAVVFGWPELNAGTQNH